ncbi:GNAT family N-acetyltransferase [Corynebacterium tapiri]|uniref:GNAT family N-acetyltransferase n=1 Tax=Corynebacterium tapiri TaxID=1448266 RepID=A0A5C4U5P8_9CORY|nr:GNAT family N-acetyltransferase [Corynebacterium tapiri]TNL99408.1 GNAT family N-acetyltransferase [Corynebacterium tapiri]
MHLRPDEFLLLTPELVKIHLAAMDYPPGIFDSRLRAWRSDRLKPGFHAVVATHDSEVLGVAYGFLGDPAYWWDRQLRHALRGLPSASQPKIDLNEGYFEVAEIHVHPDYQGAGIGRRLITALLDGAPAHLALLSTPEVAGEHNAAFGLYRSLGFFDVLRHHYYESDPRAFAILGAWLPLASSSGL